MRVTKDDLLWGSKWLAAFVMAQWAAIPPTVITLVIVMGFDIVTGTLSAFVQHRVSSDASLRGLVKKTLILMLIGATHAVGRELQLPDGIERVIAIGFIANEFISILENVGNSGAPIPPQLVEFMKRFQKLKSGAEPKPDEAKP